MVAKVGKEKLVYDVHKVDEAIAQAVEDYAAENLKNAIFDKDKQTREAHMDEVKEEARAHFEDIYPEQMADVGMALDALTKRIVRRMISVDKIRPDGRALNEIRPITCEVGLLARTHGSALFTRGQTQALTVTTLAPLSEKQTIDDVSERTEKRYIHQYNFPSYSVGETRPTRGPGRREIGHGAPCVSFRKFWNPTVPLPWQAFAAARCR